MTQRWMSDADEGASMDTNPTVLTLERMFGQPVPLTLGGLRDVLSELLAMGVTGTTTLDQLRPLLAGNGLLDLPLTSVMAMVTAVAAMPAGAAVEDFTPRELEDLLGQVQ